MRKQRQSSHSIVEWISLGMQGRLLYQSERKLIWRWAWTNILTNTFRNDLANRFNKMQKCIIKQANNYKKWDTKTWKHSGKVVHKSVNQESPETSYISLKLYSSIWSKTLLQRLHQTGICSSYYHLKDIISDWVANALQVNTDSNQIILLKLQEMTFTVFTKDNIDK